MILHKKIIAWKYREKEIVFDYIEKLKEKKGRKLRVLDIGGGMNNWAAEYVTHVIDYFHTEKENPEIILFNFNMEDYESWDVVFDDVKKFGKFDFIISTHTLEDLNNPSEVCKIINRIGESGFVAVPSKYAEFTVHENWYPSTGAKVKGYKGFHHHRWVFTMKDNVFIGYPKLGLLEHINLIDYPTNKEPASVLFTEIYFIWEDNFSYEFVAPWQLIHNTLGENKINALKEKDDFPADDLITEQ